MILEEETLAGIKLKIISKKLYEWNAMMGH